MRRRRRFELREVALNGGAIAATGDAGVHLVAYFGDANGNGAYSATDASRILRLAVGLDGGLAAYSLVDPVILADINGNGSLSATDATRVLQHAVGLTRPEIPPLPGDELAQAVAVTFAAMVPDSGEVPASAEPVAVAAVPGPAPLDAEAVAVTDSPIFVAASDPDAAAAADDPAGLVTALDRDTPGSPPLGVAVPAGRVEPRREASERPPLADDAAGSDTPRVPVRQPASAPWSSHGGARAARRLAVLAVPESGPIHASRAAWTWFVGSARRRARPHLAIAPGRLASLRADLLPPGR